MKATRGIWVLVFVAAVLLANLAPALAAQSNSDLVPPAAKGLKAVGPIATAAGYSPVLLSSSLPPARAWGLAVGLPGNPILIVDHDAWGYDKGVTSLVAQVDNQLLCCRFERNWGTFAGDRRGNLYRIHPVPGTLEWVAVVEYIAILGLDIDPSNGTIYFGSGGTYGSLLFRLAKGSHSPEFVQTLPLDNRGMAVVGNNLYIADTFGTIWRMPKSGGTPKPFVVGLDYPTDVKADAAGNLFIAECGAGNILKVRKGTNKAKIIASGFDSPRGVDVDQYGNVYFCEQGPGLLWKLVRTF
jgi:hypothetical protein